MTETILRQTQDDVDTRQLHWRNIRPKDSALKPIGKWLTANRGCYQDFKTWLSDASYSKSSVTLYGVGARLVFALVDKPYWLINLDDDFSQVRTYVAQQFTSPGTRTTYLKGITKLEAFLRVRTHRPKPADELNWAYYMNGLPTWLGENVRAFLAHRRRAWRDAEVHYYSMNLLGQLTRGLRAMTTNANWKTLADLTPTAWFGYVDARLAAGISPVTLNAELTTVQAFVSFFAEQGESVCVRLIELEPLKEPTHLPRDLALEKIQLLLKTIHQDATSTHAGVRRMGVMDKAWFLLMLHSGLRTAEVRRLTLEMLDFPQKKARIEQSKGLKDRVVYLSSATIDALNEYLRVRGPTGTETNYVFLFRHIQLSRSYISERLLTYGERCGVRATPHQLRHTCATLLLNAGAPVLTVQTILGHKHVDTTLGYARLYDGTVAADYYRAMSQVEQRLATQDDLPTTVPSVGELLALVDSLQTGTLSESQRETVNALRTGIAALNGSTTDVSKNPPHAPVTEK